MRGLSPFNMLLYASKFRQAAGRDKAVEFSSVLAERAFVALEIVVFAEVAALEYARNGDACGFGYRGEDRADGDDPAAVITDALRGARKASSGRRRRNEQKDVLVRDEPLHIA